jgi:gliding motility associated protien GldN
MKAIYYISLLVLLCAISVDSLAQTRTRQRPSDVRPIDNSPTLTERARIKNERESASSPEHLAWLREMYRYIDLEKDENAPLLYPTEPIGSRMNLFSILFRLVVDGKVNAYQYNEGGEVFEESRRIDVEDLLKNKLQVIYTTQGTGINTRYTVDDGDVPSGEVLLYMIKEAWYFDKSTANFNSRVLAICPILTRMDYYTGVVNKEALFWVVYDDIRPYISREMIMTSNYNNVLQFTMDDYFTKQMYDGEIVKTVNLRNQSLAQQVGNDPETLKLAQDSIESQLKAFNKNLWVFPPDTTGLAAKEAAVKASQPARESRNQSRNERAQQSRASRTESVPATPTRSVRRR